MTYIYQGIPYSSLELLVDQIEDEQEVSEQSEIRYGYLTDFV
jgi:hypothetical protein